MGNSSPLNGVARSVHGDCIGEVMDTGSIVAVACVLAVFFLITSQARDRSGKKYGLRKMGTIWVYALGFLGAFALVNPTVTVEGETHRLSLVPLVLLLLPFAMIVSNLRQRRRNRARQAQPTSGASGAER